MTVFKFSLFMAATLAVSLLLEVMRVLHEVPIAFLDAMFWLAGSVLLYSLLKRAFTKKIRGEDKSVNIRQLADNLLLISLLAMPYVAWSVWGIWGGTLRPFDYLSAARGGLHGYTVMYLAILLMVMWLCILLKLVKSWRVKKSVG